MEGTQDKVTFPLPAMSCLKALVVASLFLIPASAHAQATEPLPPPTPSEPAPSPPAAPAPPAPAVTPTAPAPVEPAPTAPAVTVATPAALADKESPKFHIGVGFGPSGSVAGGNVGADKVFAGSGFSVQLKVGLRFSEKVRGYLLSLNHFYAKTDQTTGPAGTVLATQWRIVGIQGVGADYFVLPKLALRGAVGLGGDFNSELGKDPSALGFSYLLGLSAELFDGDHRLTIDPYVHMLNYNRANLEPNTGNQWLARPVIGITANYAFH